MKLHGEKFAELSGTQIKVLAGKGHSNLSPSPRGLLLFVYDGRNMT